MQQRLGQHQPVAADTQLTGPLQDRHIPAGQRRIADQQRQHGRSGQHHAPERLGMDELGEFQT